MYLDTPYLDSYNSAYTSYDGRNKYNGKLNIIDNFSIKNSDDSEIIEEEDDEDGTLVYADGSSPPAANAVPPAGAAATEPTFIFNAESGQLVQLAERAGDPECEGFAGFIHVDVVADVAPFLATDDDKGRADDGRVVMYDRQPRRCRPTNDTRD